MDLIMVEWPDASCGVTSGGFDLEHVGSQVSEDFATQKATFVGKVEHAIGA
jgi:hypothetical protein